ncbi:hypothetical protein evm_003808 [Chilo suppressalis]|nr:hypothetical protein evm_003808 [Chilo suppressalis]
MIVILKNVLLYTLLEISLITLTDQTFHGKHTRRMRKVTHPLQSDKGRRIQHAKPNTTTRFPTVKDIHFYTNEYQSDARRYEYYTTPDFQDHSFRSLIEEYREVARMLHSTAFIMQQFQPHQNSDNQQYQQIMQRFQHDSAVATVNYRNEMNVANVQQYYETPERFKRTKNLDYIYKRWKTALTAGFVHTTKLQQMPRVSIPALIRGYHPTWDNGIGRQGDEFGGEQHWGGEVDDVAEDTTKDRAKARETTAGPQLAGGDPGQQGAGAAQRFTTPTTTTPKPNKRTTPYRISMAEDCDYNAYYCLKAFDTGYVCGRSLFMTFHTFKNYCMLEFVNCIERSEAWQPAHMGECFELHPLSEYKTYFYSYDGFLRNYYVADDL